MLISLKPELRARPPRQFYFYDYTPASTHAMKGDCVPTKASSYPQNSQRVGNMTSKKERVWPTFNSFLKTLIVAQLVKEFPAP
jgi:hypothetical protein